MGYRYYLQPHGSENTNQTKHTCPSCHCLNCFTYYVYWDGTKEVVLDETCGRCDHQSRCKYHKTPRDLFEENPDKKPQADSFNSVTGNINHNPNQVQASKPDYIDVEYVLKSLSSKNNLVSYLQKIVPDKQKLEEVLHAYLIGSTRDWEIIYWQIDREWNVRTGKIMKYNPFDGHRMKCKGTDWIHSRIQRSDKTSEKRNFHLRQCLFGEHLLNLYPYMPVGVVESEKTAILCALVFPQYLWLATGGLYNMNKRILRVLEGRSVVLIPDLDGYDLWEKHLDNLPDCKAVILDTLEHLASPEDYIRKIDVGDIIIRYLLEET